MTQYSSDFHTLPDSIQNTLKSLVTQVPSCQIILFGSRARGDHRPNSDFDIVLKFKSDLPSDQWTKIKLMIDENPQSLFKIDLLRWDELNSEYRANIESEGKVIYGPSA